MMKLPRLDPTAKKGPGGSSSSNKKKDIKYTPEQMAMETVDLSGFRNKRFSRAGLKELIDGIQMLPCIRTVIL